MKNRKLMFIWGGVLLMIILPLLSMIYLSHEEDDFSCESRLIIIDKENNYNVIMHYTFAKGFGRFESLGSFHLNGRPPVTHANNFPFRYWKEQGETIMVSDDTSEDSGGMKQIMSSLPDFFNTKDRGLRVHIMRENDSGYLFADNSSPLFYCTHITNHVLNQN